jgi:hypothetical protein
MEWWERRGFPSQSLEEVREILAEINKLTLAPLPVCTAK